MQFTQRLVALVGRPNVGKSRLFNRLAGRRIAIVHDEPGVTRDLVMAEVGGDFTLVDTGGIGQPLENTPVAIAAAAAEQVDFAIEAASVLVWVTDGRAGVTHLDELLAEKLRTQASKVILAVNKVDDEDTERQVRLAEFRRLGFGPPVAVSAEHGRGAETLLELIRSRLGSAEPGEAGSPSSAGGAGGERRIAISFVGRPNVGKSSLGNALLQWDRLVVSDVPGTTRDAVEIHLDYKPRSGGEDWRFRLIDTAGIRTRGKVSSSVEFFSNLRTQDAIAQSDVVFLLTDAREGITRQDQRLAGEINDAGRGMVVVVNKWDTVQETFRHEVLPGYTGEPDFRKKYAQAVRKELFFLPQSPVFFVSAKTGYNLDGLLKAAVELDGQMDRVFSTAQLNRVMAELVEKRPPRRIHSGRFKIYYATQTGTRPYRVRIFCNQEEKLEDTYRRYLEQGVLQHFGVEACPVRFELVGKVRDAEGRPVKRGKRFGLKGQAAAKSRAGGTEAAAEDRGDG